VIGCTKTQLLNGAEVKMAYWFCGETMPTMYESKKPVVSFPDKWLNNFLGVPVGSSVVN